MSIQTLITILMIYYNIISVNIRPAACNNFSRKGCINRSSLTYCHIDSRVILLYSSKRVSPPATFACKAPCYIPERIYKSISHRTTQCRPVKFCPRNKKFLSYRKRFNVKIVYIKYIFYRNRIFFCH